MEGSPRIDELRQKFHENPRRYFAPLANEYRKAGDPEQAIAICRAHLAQQPGHMSGHVVYGQALFDARRIDEARTVFEKALSLDPDNPIVLRKLGDIARQRGDATEAKHWYGRAIDTDPHNTEVAAYIAELTEPLNESVADAPAEIASATEEEMPYESDAADESQLEEDASPYRDDEADVPQAVGDAASLGIDEIIPVVPPQDEVAWRNTPAHEDSPFVTRTMAELYAKQGFREAALDVYRQLALSNPDDEEIVARIGELSVDPDAKVETETPRADSLPDIEADLLSWGELASDAAYSPSSEELNARSSEQTGEPDAPLSGDKHFTEMELSGGDSWDTDMWGAGFSSEESVPLEFDGQDTPALAEASEAEEAAELADEATPNETPTVTHESIHGEDVVDAATVEEVVPREVVPEEVVPEEVIGEALASKETVAEEVVEGRGDDAHLVAYSPQPPDASELAHYTPQGPTIREFFAAIASRRPPSEQAAQSFTARAAVPMPDSALAELPGGPTTAPSGVESAREFGEDVFPLAADAFSGLFPQSHVSEEDTRAAFALSGAVSGSAPGVPQPLEPPPRAPVEPLLPSSAEQGQESEEDIRRFREWLDGLAGT